MQRSLESPRLPYPWNHATVDGRAGDRHAAKVCILGTTDQRGCALGAGARHPIARRSKARSPRPPKTAVSTSSIVSVTASGMCGMPGVSEARIPSLT